MTSFQLLIFTAIANDTLWTRDRRLEGVEDSQDFMSEKLNCVNIADYCHYSFSFQQPLNILTININ